MSIVRRGSSSMRHSSLLLTHIAEHLLRVKGEEKVEKRQVSPLRLLSSLSAQLSLKEVVPLSLVLLLETLEIK